MQLEVGAVTEGKVTGITKFGAFIEIEKGITGLVHISEISQSYVDDISKVLKIGDIVKVKILNYENKKLSLSIKKTQENIKQKKDENKAEKKQTLKEQKKDTQQGKEKEDTNSTFEDMLAKFKKNSEEKMSDIRRNLDGKRSSYSRRR